MNLKKVIILFMRKVSFFQELSLLQKILFLLCVSFRRKPESRNFYYYISLLIAAPYAFASVSNGPYIGLEAGVANQILNYNVASFNMSTNSVNLTNSASAFLMRGNLGYNLNKYSGFELGTTYNFNADHPSPNGSATFNVNATTLDAAYLLSLPTVVEKLSVFGRIGFAYDWINSNSSCGCAISNAMSGSNFADILGAGIKYSISPKLSWRLEWIANGLIFPVGINSGGMQANWTNQTFQTGLNYSF